MKAKQRVDLKKGPRHNKIYDIEPDNIDKTVSRKLVTLVVGGSINERSEKGEEEMSDKVCKNCWHWEAPDYSQMPEKCALEIYDRPYGETEACDEFEDRYEDEEE